MINIIIPSRYKLNKKLIRQRIESYLEKYYLEKNSTINIVFVGKRKMKGISANYKHENVALPVLAFPYKSSAQNEYLLGEVFICYPQAVLLAAERSKRVDEMIVSLIEHGVDNLFK
ncbi:MAG: rRNA maturation RNAse YbeY [Candidatus Roizmanbacteria bacterium]|nr:MAG: rRNA maturation RNAse YbeY [Candidatus Roizmanbacteria bacterium]